MANITFNLDNSLIEFIKIFSKEKNITQKEVVEIGLKEIRKRKLREDAKQFFGEMSSEMKEECLWLANAWLEDYNKNLIGIENAK